VLHASATVFIRRMISALASSPRQSDKCTTCATQADLPGCGITPISAAADNDASSSSIYYFGYGALVNPVSRKRRGVETVSEQPAVLTDYRLTFGYGGAANIVRKCGWDVHGVLMKCKSDKDWQILKDFDAGYDCVKVSVMPYSPGGPAEAADDYVDDGDDDHHQPIEAYVFVMGHNEEDKSHVPLDRLPQERYVRIIASGMRHHGVDEDYVQYQILNVNYLPDRKPEDYLQFPPLETKTKKLQYITMKEYEKKAGDRNWFIIGDRVIQVGKHDESSAFMGWAQHQIIGRQDCTFTILQTLYDPDLPECEEPDSVTEVHHAWAENQMVDKFDQADVPANFVYRLRRSASDDGLVGQKRRGLSLARLSLSTKKLLSSSSKRINKNDANDTLGDG